MGEIKVRVRLSNTFDEMLRRRGKLGKRKVRTYEADAVVDTGAVRSVIPPFVMKQLGAMAADKSVASYADGRTSRWMTYSDAGAGRGRDNLCQRPDVCGPGGVISGWGLTRTLAWSTETQRVVHSL